MLGVPPWPCSAIVVCEFSSPVGPPVDDVPPRVGNEGWIDYRHHSSCEGRFGMIRRTFFFFFFFFSEDCVVV